MPYMEERLVTEGKFAILTALPLHEDSVGRRRPQDPAAGTTQGEPSTSRVITGRTKRSAGLGSCPQSVRWGLRGRPPWSVTEQAPQALS